MMMFTTGILESNALLHWSCDISNEYIYEYKVDAYVFLFRLIDFWYHFFFFDYEQRHRLLLASFLDFVGDLN